MTGGRETTGDCAAGEADGTREVVGDGVGQGASASEIEGADEVRVGGARVSNRVGAGEAAGVGIGEDDGVGVSMHEVDCPPARVGASGEIAGEGAAKGTDVAKVADDIEGYVED